MVCYRHRLKVLRLMDSPLPLSRLLEQLRELYKLTAHHQKIK
jgi:hypothetical protein